MGVLFHEGAGASAANSGSSAGDIWRRIGTNVALAVLGHVRSTNPDGNMPMRSLIANLTGERKFPESNSPLLYSS